MQPRMKNPALVAPDVFEALQGLAKAALHAATEAGLPRSTIELVNLRASQINGCSVCLDMHSRGLKKMGESDERLHTVAGWRDAPYFTEPERAALALAEAGTRLADHPDAVNDDLYAQAAKYFDEPALAALVVHIALINAWNRLNIITGQVAGEWTAQYSG